MLAPKDQINENIKLNEKKLSKLSIFEKSTF